MPASAAVFTLSDGNGSGPFGTVTGVFTSATSYELHFDMNPNFVIDTGSHFSLSLSLNTGTISAAATTEGGLATYVAGSPFTVLPHTIPASYTNPPFGDFTDAVAGDCGPAGQGGCGSDLWISVTGVNSALNLFNPATNLFPTNTGVPGYAAMDIFDKLSGKTFVVGLGDTPVPTPFTSAVPEPSTWAMMLLGFLGIGLFGMRGKAGARSFRMFSA